MQYGWPLVPLGEILDKSDEWVDLDPQLEYKEVTVRLWGRGVVLRGIVSGARVAGSRRLRVRPREFIASRIDARNGAFGLIPAELDGAMVTNDFPVFITHENRLLPEYLGWLSKTHEFVESCKGASEGTTNRVRLKEDKFIRLKIPLPPLPEQQRIVARIERLAAKIEETRGLKQRIEDRCAEMLKAMFAKVVRGAPTRTMGEVAPLVRRPIEAREGELYPELGIRSFGKGTFQKPPLDFLEVGTKRIFRIEPGDLLFSNVFAWEGAIAVAQPEDAGRFGSHRFITCIPEAGLATSSFLCFYFLTSEGLEKIRVASPGGAGRNRTLGLEKLAQIEVPLPDYETQLRFDQLQAKVRNMLDLQSRAAADLDALLPAILDRAFRGEL